MCGSSSVTRVTLVSRFSRQPTATRVSSRARCKTQAGVLAGGEGNVRRGFAEDVEFFGPFPALLIPVCRPHAHPDHRPRRYRNAFQLNVFGGEPLHSGQRRLEAQPLFDRLGDQLGVLLDRGELVGVGQQQVKQVSRRAVGGFQPGGQQQTQEGIDGFVAELFTVDFGGDQIADDVLGRFGSAFVDLFGGSSP